jgi:hypothetical protein
MRVSVCLSKRARGRARACVCVNVCVCALQTFGVPKGHYGVVVVNALIERHAGTVTWTSTSGLKGGQAI